MIKIGRWWDTDMASASQVLYTDPSMAFDVATTPDAAFTQNVMQYTAQQQEIDQKKVEQERQGFMGTLANWYGNVDKTLSSIPVVNMGWSVGKTVGSAVWYPVDKLAQGAHWLYSEAVSQPLSTLFLSIGQYQLDQEASIIPFTEGSVWSEAYDRAENISPGQALTNVTYAQLASGEAPSLAAGAMAGGFALPMLLAGVNAAQGNITPMNPEAGERLVYDTEYWRDKTGWTYTYGSGATDFTLLMAADPTTYITGGIGQVVKGARSIQLVEKNGELVRTRGAITDTARKIVGKQPEKVEDIAAGAKMQEFFDWVAAPSAVSGASRKTALEIEMHPIWGRGRRQNPFKAQYSQILSTWARDDMELGWRFMAGDSGAITPLMERGGKTLDDIGRLSENRVLVDTTRLDPTMIGYFAGVAGRRPTTTPPGLLDMTREQASVQAEAGIHLYRTKGVTTASDIDMGDALAWRTAKLENIDNELKVLEEQDSSLRKLLGGNLGKEAEDFSAVEATGFGGLARSYRMGSGSFTSSYKDAERAAQNKLKDRRGRFTTEGKRNGFYGTPLRVVQSFNDRVPQGFVNHNDPDSGERVFEMLREVPGLTPEARQSLHNRYMTAGDKVNKSQVLASIQKEVIEHMAINVHGLDGEVARVVSGMTEAKIGETVNKLLNVTGKHFDDTKQAYSGAKDPTGRRVDHIEDGEGWVLAPMAKTQLSQADALIPVREIERALGRVSGSMQRVRKNGGTAVDATRIAADSMNGIWKAATLLRPAYVPRMLSEELVLAGVKFGFMSRIVMDGGKGAVNFALNRKSYIQAVRGKGSYTPTTGGGIESSIVKIDDPGAIATVRKHQANLRKQIARESDPLKRSQLQSELKNFKIDRIRVSEALPVVTARLKMEREVLANLERDLADYQGRYAATQARLAAPPTLGSGPGTPAWTRMGNSLTAYQDKIDNLMMRIDDHKNVISEFQDYYGEIYRTALASTGRRLGEDYFEVAGYRIPQAFSGEWANPIARDQISSHSAMSTIYARAESIDMQRMIQSGSWTYITPDQPQHMQSWIHAINRQFGQDELFVKVMEDPTGAAAQAWLRTPAGKQHLKDLGIRARNPQQLIDDIGMTLDKYLPADTGLRQKVINGEDVTEADLVGTIARSDYPTVHGEEILEKTALSAKDTAGNIIDRVIEKGFKRLGSIPSDVISRHPTYLHFQEGRFKELMQTELSARHAMGKDEALGPDVLDKILEKSDQLARKDMSKLVYDPARTTAAEALRFISPFFSAHADSLARWGGMIAEKPQMTGRIAQIYNAPVAANLITDEYGNLVGKDGYVSIVDPSTIEYDENGAPIPGSGKVIGREFVPIDKRVFQLRAPWKKKSEGSIPIKVSAMNTILPGDPWFNPGSGPLVQVTGSQIAKSIPQVGDFLQWSKVLPYGPTDTTTAVIPKYMRSIWDAYKGDDPDNEEYQKAYLAIWNKKQMEYHLQGKPIGKDILKEIDREAKEFLYLSVLESWGSFAQTQATPLTGSPYQFYVDQLGQMRKVDPENYRDNFLAKFGTDFGGFTASLTKSMGIAATISADAQAEKYKDQIAADPEMAQFWVGDIHNGGPFSQSVYQKQLEQNFGSEMARQKITAEEAIERSQSERGWYEYRTAKAYIDSLLIRNGYKSYTQKGAEPYNQARKQLIAGISARYPAWENAFNTVDRSKVKDRIRSFEMAIMDEKLMSDPMRYEMPSLARYLQGRREFKAILDSQGLSKLSYDVEGKPTGQSAAIGYAWEQFKMGLINENVAFGDLYNRYLTNDDLQ